GVRHIMVKPSDQLAICRPNCPPIGGFRHSQNAVIIGSPSRHDQPPNYLQRFRFQLRILAALSTALGMGPERIVAWNRCCKPMIRGAQCEFSLWFEGQLTPFPR